MAAYLKWWQRLRAYGKLEVTVQGGEIVYVRIEGTAKDIGGPQDMGAQGAKRVAGQN